MQRNLLTYTVTFCLFGVVFFGGYGFCELQKQAVLPSAPVEPEVRYELKVLRGDDLLDEVDAN